MPQTSTIAIVDDDQAIREALDDLVQSCGYNSELFTSAEQFLSYDDHAKIGCMLVDVKMPGLSGLDLLAKLNNRSSRPPVIFLTSYKDDLTRSRAMEGGAFAIFGKPVDVHKLIETLESALAVNV